ncbi:hypothetical protein KO561_17005 [Radiobacillus kanasensis]|nr:hypothetical protein [Radiobacillus kanasensis]UFT98871.1 hypothetical protein KO561_17005 [Radiobacillus kanasensis]
MKTVASEKDQLKDLLMSVYEKGTNGATLKEVMTDLEKALLKMTTK